MTTEYDYSERVCAGVAYLDRTIPGWETMIDVDTLKLDSPDRCVLAQVFLAQHPAYVVGGERPYFAELRALEMGDEEANDLGFCLADEEVEDDEDTPARWGALGNEWKRVIQDRQAEA